jgi:flagellar basal body P-ring protein FlgI
MRTLITVLISMLPSAQLLAQDMSLRVPIRSLTRLHGAMHNTITGIGLVTGLNKTGSGDRAKASPAWSTSSGPRHCASRREICLRPSVP